MQRERKTSPTSSTLFKTSLQSMAYREPNLVSSLMHEKCEFENLVPTTNLLCFSLLSNSKSVTPFKNC